MSTMNPLDPYGGTTPPIEQMLGAAYTHVRNVSSNMQTIAAVAANKENIDTAAEITVEIPQLKEDIEQAVTQSQQAAQTATENAQITSQNVSSTASYAQAAETSKQDAQAAASEAIGLVNASRKAVVSYPTFELAQADISNLSIGQRVYVDETLWSYEVSTGGFLDKGPIAPTQTTGEGSRTRPVGQKAADFLSITDFEGNDTVALGSATIAAGRREIDLAGRTLLVDSWSNHFGAKVANGSIQQPSTLGNTIQLNSYGDECKEFIGMEYLYRLFLRAGLNMPITGYIYGDSTVATTANGGGYAGVSGEPQNLIPELAASFGNIPMLFTNRGVGGTTVLDMNAMPDIDTVNGLTDLFIIKYGINDGMHQLEGFKNNLRSKLAEIRQHPYGAVDNLAIVLVGPNATYDPEHGRASPWYEQLRGIFESASRDFQCAYFDAYAYLRRIEWAAKASGGEMMDDPFLNGQGVHPKKVMQNMLWGRFVDHVFGSSAWHPYRKAAGALWKPLPLLNGWTAYGSGFSVPEYSITDGFVQLRGLIANGVVGPNVKVATLPAEITPQHPAIFAVAAAGDVNPQLRVVTSGYLEQHSTNASAIYTSLEGIRYALN